MIFRGGRLASFVNLRLRVKRRRFTDSLDQLTPTPIEPIMGPVVLLTKRLCAASVHDN